MIDRVRVQLRLKADAWGWFWDDLVDGLVATVRSRRTLVLVGDAALLLCAVAGLAHYWSHDVTFGGVVVLQVACLVCQAVALVPVAWPGRAATPWEVAKISDLYQSVTVATVCGTWIFGMFPGAVVMDNVMDDTEGPMAALLIAGTALMMACLAGLITAVSLTHRSQERAWAADRERRARDGEELLDDSGSADHGDVDAGDFGGAD
ncbi:hypothetical protein [Streptomyces sp. NPDC050704]|uniref:hypothetical protein n=1 Tax=Streptomyces sp. NPDC050704 TaxID=3157219 RepID=UPI00343B49D1